MPYQIERCRFIIDYVLTADNCKPRRVKKHRVDVMTYGLAGSVDTGLTQNLIKRDKTLQKQNQITVMKKNMEAKAMIRPFAKRGFTEPIRWCYHGRTRPSSQ